MMLVISFISFIYLILQTVKNYIYNYIYAYIWLILAKQARLSNSRAFKVITL